MNQSARTFVLSGLVVVFLLALHNLPDLTIFGKGLRHVNILSDVIAEPAEPVREPEIPLPQIPKPQAAVKADSLRQDTVRRLANGDAPIDDYSSGAAGGMWHFYSMLAKISALDRPVRIAYYGDSFIEGDILTCDLRENLQRRFGGNGVGWVDCCSKTSGFRPTVKHKFGGFSEYEVVKKPFDHKNEGLSQRYFVPEEEAFVSVSGTGFRRHSARWQVASLFVRTAGPLTVSFSVNGRGDDVHNVSGSTDVQMISLTDSMRSLTCRFSGVGDGVFAYGIALESKKGVILDNFSMRGSAGHTLADIPSSTLSGFARLRQYDLIVLHFGLNILDGQNTTAVYKNYVKRMSRVVAKFRAAYPEASILIVSVPDRDQRTADGIRTINGLEALAAYQQLLASECGVAYFNLFKAMGGHESMKAMVDKGLANKDYTHLNFSGGRYVAKLLFKSLMDGYENYKQSGGKQ